MNSFDENAFFLLVWRAILVALVGAVLLVTHPFALDVALLAAGNIALVFYGVLMACAASLTEDRIVRSEAWRLLAPAERPFGVGGRRWACNHLKKYMLQFAKGGSVVAIMSSVLALMVADD
jgi:membrane-bound ClpP family serine protease